MIKKKKLIFVFIALFFSLNLTAQNKTDVFSKEIYTKNLQTNCLEIFKLIKKKGVKLTYSSNDFDFNRKIILSKNNYNLKELLEVVIANRDIRIIELKGKIVLTSQPINSSDKITISGFIKENSTKEVLIGATVYVKGTNKGTVANSYGFYSLSLPRNKYILEISYVGFEKQKIEIDLTKTNLTQNFYLIEENKLDPVIIKANPNKRKIYNRSDKRITKKDMNKAPMLLGENDPLKYLKLSAGVSGSMDNTTTLNVRSGGSDENLILIDGTPVYNHNHLGGIASIFNTNVIKHIDVHRGRFPSKYNGRLSSVIDIRTKDGHMTEYHGRMNLNPISFSLTAEGPIKKNKASFISSFRRSSLDLINKILSSDSGFDYGFYDYNFKTNYFPNNSDRFFLSAYIGKDDLEIKNFDFFRLNNLKLNLENQLVSFKWNHIYNPKTFQHLSVTYSNFKSSFLGDFFDRFFEYSNINSKMTNKIKDISLTNDIEYFASEKLKTNFGVSLKFIEFTQNLSKFNANEILESSLYKNQSFHLNAYAENKIKFNNKFLLKAGVNITNYFLPSKTYNYFLPRLSFFYTPNNKHTFFGAFNSISQFNHEITSATFSLPNELRAPSTKKTPPKRATLFEIGYIYNLNKKDYFSIKSYYKKVKGIIIYRPGQDAITNNVAMNWEDRFLYGKGIRKGIEFETRKHLGKKLKMTLNYTLSNSDNSFDEINEGKYFPSALDFRHIINASTNFYVNNSISLNSTFSYSTGKRINIPTYNYTNFDDAIDVEDSGVLISLPATLQVSSLNTHRLPNNYNFSLGGTYKKKFKNNTSLQINTGVYNLLGNAPPVFLDATLNDNSNKIRLDEIKLKRNIPYLNISYEF
ncbi:TonB-dependent receptor [Aquimarina longa]|uniref:TonB-dependent receptor n=1 Tax=Aquimarina longa TaxID=1080221 RepID=UPI0007861D96|nr:TonB-dependent receptor [Aquimarina longa]